MDNAINKQAAVGDNMAYVQITEYNPRVEESALQKFLLLFVCDSQSLYEYV